MKLLKVFLVGVSLLAGAEAHAASGAEAPRQMDWPFDGVTGTFDRAAIQRGFKVYKEVCASCHSLKRVAFRNLTDIGFTEEQVKSLAATYSFTDGPDDAGEMFERPGKPSDRFPSPFANEQAARASNNGAFPPDLSLIVKARPHGPDYIYSLLTGYHDAPEGVEVPDGMHYNPYFPGGKLAMAAPLAEGAVTFDDGTEATVDQMARDVVNFLQWTSEPEMEHRKSTGFKVMLFLFIATVFMYLAKRKIWAKIKH